MFSVAVALGRADHKRNGKRKMKKENSKKRSNIIIAAIGTATVLFAIGIILALELAPMLEGNAEFSRRYSAVERGSFTSVTVTDFYSTSGTFPEVVEVDIVSQDEISELRDMFLSAVGGAKFAAAEKKPYGGLDISIRFAEGGKSTEFYLRKDEIYLQIGAKKYSFKPESAERFDEFYKFIESKLEVK